MWKKRLVEEDDESSAEARRGWAAEIKAQAEAILFPLPNNPDIQGLGGRIQLRPESLHGFRGIFFRWGETGCEHETEERQDSPR